MDDDEVFERSMASLGVEPLPGQRKERREAPLPQDVEAAPDVEESDRLMFEKAMRDLEPPKRGAKAGSEGRRVERVRVRAGKPRIEDEIDLHGLRGSEAIARLEGFVASAARQGLKAVLVITGKGHHSPGGRGVLKQRVEGWIHGTGRRRVRAYSEAPRTLGGRGAYVLLLRRGG